MKGNKNDHDKKFKGDFSKINNKIIQIEMELLTSKRNSRSF